MTVRDRRLEVRLTADEAASIDERARLTGRSRSDYVRHALTGRHKDRAAASVSAEELRAAMVELKRCGNNANQIARKLNAGLATPEVNACLKELSAATAKVAEAVKISRGA